MVDSTKIVSSRNIRDFNIETIQVGELLVWDGSGFIPTTVSGIGINFLDLDDTPVTYAGNAGKILRVNSIEDALEFDSIVQLDIANSRLGINEATPLTSLHVSGSDNVQTLEGDEEDDGVVGTVLAGQLIIQGASDTNKRLSIGYDTVNNNAFIGAAEVGTAWRNIVIARVGGNVGIGMIPGAFKLDLTGSQRLTGNLTFGSGGLITSQSNSAQIFIDPVDVTSTYIYGLRIIDSHVGYNFTNFLLGVSKTITSANTGVHIGFQSVITTSHSSGTQSFVTAAQIQAVHNNAGNTSLLVSIAPIVAITGSGTITNAHAIDISLNLSGTGTVSTGRGIHAQVLNTNASGTFSNAIGVDSILTNSNTGNMPTAIGMRARILNTSTGSITNAYGMFIQSSSNPSGTLTNNYGLYVEAQSAGGTLNYAIYTNAGLVHFGDDIDIASGKNIQLDTATGTKIGTATTQKLGFYNQTPVVQQNTTGTTAGHTAGAGTAVDDASTFTGNTGATAYTIGDVVRALKLYGLLAS